MKPFGFLTENNVGFFSVQIYGNVFHWYLAGPFTDGKNNPSFILLDFTKKMGDFKYILRA